MRKRTLRTGLAVALLLGAGAMTGGVIVWAGAKSNSDNPQAWRARGPQGLDEFWEQHHDAIEAHRARLRADDLTDDPQWDWLSAQLDVIAGQRNAWSSHLYWYTDLDAARAAAQAQHKPILSLRLLGKLTDEYSCVNSRFFRTALYANADVSKILREKFILHWKTERPVPIVTVDMGDGRVLKRTLTGNSVHYLLDAQGRPLDALPGLYGPGAFSAWLEQGVTLFRNCDGHDAASRLETLHDYHDSALHTIADDYAEDAYPSLKGADGVQNEKIEQRRNGQREKYAAMLLKGFETQNPLGEPSLKTVSAPVAERLTASKAAIEMPLLDATRLYSLPSDASAATGFESYYWAGATDKRLPASRLDANSRLLMHAQRPPLAESTAKEENPNINPFGRPSNIQFSPFPLSRAKVPAPPANLSPYERLIDNFERTMAQDTERNELRLHAPLHEWFLTNDVTDLEALNRIVYDRLLLAPSSDAWMGLSPQGTYTGLDNGGLFGSGNAPAPTAPQQQLQRQAQLSR